MDIVYDSTSETAAVHLIRRGDAEGVPEASPVGWSEG